MSSRSSNAEFGVVVDNGAGSIKAGKVSFRSDATQEPPLVATNALARPGPNASVGRTGKSKRPMGMLVAGEVDVALEYSAMAFKRCHDRGYIVRWDTERDVWASIFSSDFGINLVDPSAASLLVTEPFALPSNMRNAMDELVFEYFRFAEYGTGPAARFAAAAPNIGDFDNKNVSSRTALVLDSGYSFTHAVPVVNGWEQRGCVRRLNLGGKALTNQLKEIVSFRSWNMMDETAVVNAVKERLCYVSSNFMEELLLASDTKKSPIRREYILPDVSKINSDPLGHLRGEEEELDGSEQILVMNNERISIPEMLFQPSDIGLAQAGVAELIVQSVQAVPLQYQPDLYANIVLTGGNCLFPGFRKRLETELRSEVNEYFDITVHMDRDPTLTCYYGAVNALADSNQRLQMSVSKAEYEEHGHRLTSERFNTGRSASET